MCLQVIRCRELLLFVVLYKLPLAVVLIIIIIIIIIIKLFTVGCTVATS